MKEGKETGFKRERFSFSAETFSREQVEEKQAGESCHKKIRTESSKSKFSESPKCAPVLYAKDLPEQIEPYEGVNFWKAVNSQPNDKKIVFVDEGHKYFVRWIEGNQISREQYTSCSVSVSGFVHDCFPHFDGPAVVDKMQQSPRWKFNTKYHGMSKEEILASWKAHGELCSTQGSKFHYLLECFYNGMEQPLRTGKYANFKVIRMFLDWHKSAVEQARLQPYRTEMQLMSEADLRLTGTIDILFVEKDHPPPEETNGVLTLLMKDWKFSSGIKLTNKFETGLAGGPAEDLPACNGYKYFLQLNSYKYLIQNPKVYNCWRLNGKIYNRVEIKDMELVVFHDSQEQVQTFTVPDLSSYVLKIAQRRREYLKENPPVDKDAIMPEKIFQEMDM